MARIDKLERARQEGMSYALEVARKKGIEGLEEELRMRGVTGIPIGVSRSAVDKVIENIKNQTLDTVNILTAMTLHDEFGSGSISRRLKKGLGRYAKSCRKEKKEMIDEKRLIKECEERLLVGTNVIKLIEEQPKICEWIPLEEKTPENGEHVLLSFANEKQNPLVGTWKVDDEGGAFYAPFTGRTYASLGCFVTAWMPLPEPYRPDDSMKDEERLVL